MVLSIMSVNRNVLMNITHRGRNCVFADWPREPLLCTAHKPFYALGFAMFLHQQMAGNIHESIGSCKQVHVCVRTCVCVCVYLCGRLLSALFVILMKGSGHARVKRDACWHR